MHKVAIDLVVDAPLHRVYEVLHDVDRHARLVEEFPMVRAVRLEPSSHGRIVHVDLPGRTLRATLQIDASPPYRIGYTADGDWTERGEAVLERIDRRRTRLVFHAEYEIPGATGAVLRALGLDDRMFRRHLQRVKEEAEAYGYRGSVAPGISAKRIS